MMNEKRKKIIEEDLASIYSRTVPWKCLDNKTVFITGAYGMLASYMVFMLIWLNEQHGMNISIIAQGRSKERLEKRFGYAGKFPYLKFFISELDQELTLQERPDYIVHAASIANPALYGICPIKVLSPNIMGSYHLLEFAARSRITSYLLFSSGDVYGKVGGTEQIGEEDYGAVDPLDIHNCYGESKRMAEAMCAAWLHEKGVLARVARIWHTYAPTMDIEKDPRVFASFVRDIINGRDIIMKSDGSAKRSFCYITDAIAGYFLILLRGEAGKAYNVCNSGEFLSISELAETLVDLYPERNLRVRKTKREKDDPYLENYAANWIPPDSCRLEALGWKAEIDVRTGFRRVIESFIE